MYTLFYDFSLVQIHMTVLKFIMEGVVMRRKEYSTLGHSAIELINVTISELHNNRKYTSLMFESLLFFAIAYNSSQCYLNYEKCVFLLWANHVSHRN